MEETIFDRSILLWGTENQAKLAKAKVVILGLGGLGSAVAQVLVRAGISQLTLIDQKKIDLPDLGRQILYTKEDLGKSKVEAAKSKILKIIPNCIVTSLYQDINQLKKLPNANLFIDCLDNFATRLNVWNKLPGHSYFLHGGVQAYQGQIITLQKGNTLDLPILLATGKDNSQKIPIAPQTVMLAGSLMGNEAINILLGKTKLLGKLFQFDLDSHYFASISV